MTENEITQLKEEIDWTSENMKEYKLRIDFHAMEKGKAENLYLFWKERFRDADRKLAMGTRLTVISSNKPSTIQSKLLSDLEAMLRSPEKMAAFAEFCDNESVVEDKTKEEKE